MEREDNSAPEDAPEQFIARTFALARQGKLEDGEVFKAAAKIDGFGRPDLTIELYRTWLVNGDTLQAANGWYNLGVCLLNQHQYLLSEQAFLNAYSMGFEPAKSALESVNFRAVTQEQNILYSMFMQARVGMLDVNFFMAAYTKLSEGNANAIIFELFRLWLMTGKSPDMHCFWYEFGLMCRQLDYPTAAVKAFNTASQMNPAFILPRLALEADSGEGSITSEHLSRLTLRFTPDTARVLEDIRLASGEQLGQTVLDQWLHHTIDGSPYYVCYQLGTSLKALGNLMAAKQAFSRSVELNPDFGRGVFALGAATDSGLVTAELLDKRALLDAMDILAGKADAARIPSRTGGKLSGPDAMIVKAPHLYRHMVKNNVELLDAQKMLSAIDDDASPRHAVQIERINAAIQENSRFKTKLAALHNDQAASKHGNGRDALLVCVKGVGDHIHLNGAVRYLSTIYDTVFVGTMFRPPSGILEMYRDDPSIKWKYFSINYFSSENVTHIPALMEETFGSDVFYCNEYYRGAQPTRIPETAYDQLGMDPSYASSYFHIEESAEGDELLRLAQQAAPSHIFSHTSAHNASVRHLVDGLLHDNPDTLIINPDHNLYEPGHRFYDVAQQFLNKTIFSYIQVMSNAVQLHLVDSSFYALAHYIPKIQGQKVFCYIRGAHNLLFYERSSALFADVKLTMLD